jgi:BMFP domain-containing protein YqiC
VKRGRGPALQGGTLDLLVDHRQFILRSDFASRAFTIARKSGTDKALRHGGPSSGLELPGPDCHSLSRRVAMPPTGDSEMTQTSNRFFDEIGKLMNDAAGAAQGFKREVDAVVRNQAEKIMRDLDLVKREEFEAVKEMARLAREDNEALKARIAALEARLGGGG